MTPGRPRAILALSKPREGFLVTFRMSLKDNKLVRYFIEAKTELEKVSWPSRQEVVRSTLLVIGLSIGMAVFLGALDFGLNEGLEALLK